MILCCSCGALGIRNVLVAFWLFWLFFDECCGGAAEAIVMFLAEISVGSPD